MGSGGAGAYLQLAFRARGGVRPGQEVISIRNTMYHLRVPVFVLAALVLLHCIAAAPNHRNFRPNFSSSDVQENALPAKKGLRVVQQTGLSTLKKKRKVCTTTSCLAERLAHMKGHKGNVKEKTDVGSHSFGKRDIQPPGYLPV